MEPNYGFQYDFVDVNPATILPTGPVSSNPPRQTQPTGEEAGEENEKEEDQEEEYQFRLFTSTAGSKPTPDATHGESSSTAVKLKIRLSPTPDPGTLADEPSLDRAHFVRPNRPLTYYLTSALPKETVQELRAQYVDAAVATADVLSRAKSSPWPGTVLPWRLVHIKLDRRQESKSKLNSSLPLDYVQSQSQQAAGAAAARRSKPSKKRRILLRRRQTLRAERAAQAKVADETEREKRTRRNREKKVKRKEREKRKKLESVGAAGGGDVGDGLPSDESDVSGEETLKKGSK